MSSKNKPTPNPELRIDQHSLEKSFTHTNPDPTTKPPIASGTNASDPESGRGSNNNATANTGTAANASDDS